MAVLSEFLPHNVFGRFKGKIGNEKCVTCRAHVVSKRLGAVLTLGRSRFGLGEVDIDGTTVDLGFVHSSLSLDPISSVDKFDISKSATY